MTQLICYTMMKTIPQRELRNRVSKVLRDVEADERMRITVDGRPVADLVPVEGARRDGAGARPRYIWAGRGFESIPRVRVERI
jgi:prevent-host-death family protein